MIEGITGKKVAKRVRKIAKKNPDFVYTDQGSEDVEEGIGCSYFGRSVTEPNVGQGCIVGQALQELGVTREEMEKAGIEGYSASDALKKLGIRSSDKHLHFLDTVQMRQDIGDTWGHAVKLANAAREDGL